jgi:hypothetical protein
MDYYEYGFRYGMSVVEPSLQLWMQYDDIWK